MKRLKYERTTTHQFKTAPLFPVSKYRSVRQQSTELGHHDSGNRGDSGVLGWEELKPEQYTRNTERLLHNLWVWSLVWNQSAPPTPRRQKFSLHAWGTVQGHSRVSEGAKPSGTAVEGCLKGRGTTLVQSQPCCFLGMATATSCLTNWLGSISESTNWHGLNQSGNVLVFKQHGQSESQHSRMLCVTLQHIFSQCSQVCTIPCLGDHIPPLKHSLLREGKAPPSS